MGQAGGRGDKVEVMREVQGRRDETRKGGMQVVHGRTCSRHMTAPAHYGSMGICGRPRSQSCTCLSMTAIAPSGSPLEGSITVCLPSGIGLQVLAPCGGTGPSKGVQT